jgi:hypothetical protein
MYTLIWHQQDPSKGSKGGEFAMTVSDIQELAGSSVSILIRDADRPDQYVFLKPGVNWPLEKLAKGEAFDTNATGGDVTKECIDETWVGPCTDIMRNKDMPQKSKRLLKVGQFYEALTNDKGLHLSRGKECRFGSTEPARVEVFLGQKRSSAIITSHGTATGIIDLLVQQNQNRSEFTCAGPAARGHFAVSMRTGGKVRLLHSSFPMKCGDIVERTIRRVHTICEGIECAQLGCEISPETYKRLMQHYEADTRHLDLTGEDFERLTLAGVLELNKKCKEAKTIFVHHSFKSREIAQVQRTFVHASIIQGISFAAYETLQRTYQEHQRLEMMGMEFQHLTDVGLSQLQIEFPNTQAIFCDRKIEQETNSIKKEPAEPLSMRGAVIGPDGKVYCVPGPDATSVMVVDIATRKIEHIGKIEKEDSWAGGALHEDGKIVRLPRPPTRLPARLPARLPSHLQPTDTALCPSHADALAFGAVLRSILCIVCACD